MSIIPSEIHIDKTERDKDTLFTSRKIRIAHYPEPLTTPIKFHDFNYLKAIISLYQLDREELKNIQIVEKSHIVKEDTLFTEITRPESTFLSFPYDSLKGIPFFKDKLVVNTITLTFNPLRIRNYADSIKSFLDICYARSDLLFVPSLKAVQFDKTTKTKEKITEKEEYIRYVNLAFEALSFRNSKPIFIPLPIKYGAADFRETLKNYIDLGYRYFWMDLEGSNSSTRAIRIRAFHQVVEDNGLAEEILLHVTNIRRERNPHAREKRSEPSDILASPLGADFVGVNREPLKALEEGTKLIPLSSLEKFNHHARFLDRSNYYYTQFMSFGRSRTEEMLKRFGVSGNDMSRNPKFYSNYINSFEMNREFNMHRKVVIDENSLLDYLKTKASLPQDAFDQVKKIPKKEVKSHSLSEFF